MKSDTPFDLLISQLPDIVQKSFCTSDGAIDLTFQMNYVPVFYIFVAREIKQTLLHKFSEFFVYSPFKT